MKKLIESMQTMNKRTGERFYVMNSPRGLYFDLVPVRNPAQKPIRFDRREFTKPEVVTTAA